MRYISSTLSKKFLDFFDALIHPYGTYKAGITFNTPPSPLRLVRFMYIVRTIAVAINKAILSTHTTKAHYTCAYSLTTVLYVVL